MSGWKTLSRAAFLPYMKTVRYSYLTFAQTLLHGNNHSFTSRLYTIIITTGNVMLYTARASYANLRLPRIYNRLKDVVVHGMRSNTDMRVEYVASNYRSLNVEMMYDIMQFYL